MSQNSILGHGDHESGECLLRRLLGLIGKVASPFPSEPNTSAFSKLVQFPFGVLEQIVPDSILGHGDFKALDFLPNWELKTLL
ncbi:hypothetical protein CDAR_448631 [Caerostris darwini]|uniref:Uncharacterized protein n=1 Tax=Caerostris darwini TaxID=1538125 RepID=A0AAV4QMD7_9ARAC|nr:hypothetical protein CDAR_448631 [Caerostris darwini]